MNQNYTDRWGIIYCPRHSFFCRHKRWEKICRALDNHDIAYDYVQSESAANVARIVNLLISGGHRTIIVVGGDSALNEAANCIMRQKMELRKELVLGVIPNGVMNDFAHFWDFSDNEVERTVEMLKKYRLRKIDMGCINYRNRDGEMCHRYFLNCINIGLVSAITTLRQQTRHTLGSRTLALLLSSLIMIFQRMEYKMKLKVNNEHIERGVMNVTIGNATSYGLTPNAVPYNGMLDVSVVYQPRVFQFLEGFYFFFLGKLLNHRSVHPYRCERIEIESSGKALLNIDGHPMDTPQGSYTISVQQEVVNFIIPS